jgi:hypothetical protein
MLCGVIVAQVTKAKHELSQTISYIEMQNLAITIVDDSVSNLLCVCIHDVEDVRNSQIYFNE